MKVIHLISTDVFSGAENVACQIINYFKKHNNYEMYYASVIGEKNEEALRNRDIPCIKLKRFDYFCVKKMIDKEKPDIVHAHDIRASILAALACDRKTKIISHVHNNHENMRKLNIKTMLYIFFSSRFEKIIWVSKSAFEGYRFNSKVKNKSIILYNVIDANEIKRKAEKDNNDYNYDVIYLGRLTYQKNPERLVEIIANIIKEKSDLKVAIIGDGELRDKITEYIKANHIEENVHLYGFVSNPYKILEKSKIMLLTSRYEGTPMCALEAIALNKPIVSTPTDGLVDIIDNDKTGFLSDSNAELEAKIKKLLDDKDMYNQFVKNIKSKNIVINNINIYGDRIKNLYENKEEV